LGIDALGAFLRRHRRVAVDTSIFIYQVEGDTRYLNLTKLVFDWLQTPGTNAVTSTITMAELLVPPYRNGDERLVSEFYALLSKYPNLDWIAPDLEIADLAARLRAEYRLRTPDAIEAATALHTGASAFITNDAVFERVQGFEVLVLDRLRAPRY
jgi:predicted nucleic acid-binding protein